MTRSLLALLASMLVTFVLGSVHAFSVFLVPLERLLGLPRSEISLIYSFALVALTLAVLLGHRFYARAPSWWLIAATCALASAGLLLAARAATWGALFVGYSLCFGFSNGIGYGYCLQLGGRVMPRHRGFAMGAVTAAYALGSIVFARVFATRIAEDSVAAALSTGALGIAFCGAVAAILLRLARARYGDAAVSSGAGGDAPERAKVLQFWLAYLCSVFAGLMAIGHAAGIALAKDAGGQLATLAAIVIGIGSATGGFVAGGLLDRWPATRQLVGLPLLSALALISIALADRPGIVVAWLTLIGFCYGAIIAVYPVAIAKYFGEQGPRVYGLVFTAWGLAGLAAPWSAGWIYDWRHAYDPAMLLAAGLALLSASAAWLFRLEKVA